MPSRRIAIDARRLADYGIGTYIRNLVRALSDLDHETRYCLVVPPNSKELEGLGPNFETVVYHYPDPDPWHHIRFSGFMRRLGADLYHIPLNSVAYWMPRPYVLTIHDMSSLMFVERGEIGGRLHQERYRRGAKRAAKIIAVSDSTRRDIESVLHIDPAKIQTIYSAPDPAFADSTLDPEVHQRTLDRYSIHPPYILYVGAIRPQKNVPRLVGAFAVLRKELENNPAFRDLKLVIIGDELSQSQEVRRAVRGTRLENHVRFLGFVPVETLKVFYRSASAFAFPSLYEGFGLAPLEAMLCGTPVVTSDLPALVEAVGDAAELVIPDNAFDIARGLREVLENDDRRRQLSESGIARARRFDWRATAQAVLEIYLQIK